MSEKLELAAQRYAFSHYGELVLVDGPRYNTEEKVYVSNLRSDYPLVIQDDRTPAKRFVRVLKIDSIGSIIFDSDFKVISGKTSSREDCIKNLLLYFNFWKKRAEDIVISASADNLVRISRFRHFFDPIDAILIGLWDNHRIFDIEIKLARVGTRRKKIKLYLELLEGLEVIRRVEDGYVEGNLFLTYRQQEKNESTFRDKMLSYLIKQRYTTLRDIFRLTILEPTIHVDSCVYLPEMETEAPIHRVVESILNDYEYYYKRRINPLDLRLILTRLEDAEAINRNGRHYSGNEHLLKTMIAIKKQLPPISIGLLTNT